MPYDTSRPGLAWQDSGEMYRIPPWTLVVGGVDKMMQQYAAERPLSVANAFEVDGQMVKVGLKPAYTLLSTVIKTLPMRTTFSVLDGRIVPEFQEGPEFLRRELSWRAPSSMKLYFALKVSAPSVGVFVIHKPFLFATDGVPGFWKLPLPNQYGDGPLCLGSTCEDKRGRTLVEIWTEGWNLFKGSTWNRDQLPSMAHSKALFKFNPANNETIPVENWTAFCTRWSHSCHAEVTQ